MGIDLHARQRVREQREAEELEHSKASARRLVESLKLTPERVRAIVLRFCPPSEPVSPQLGKKHNYPHGRRSSRRGIGRMHW